MKRNAAPLCLALCAGTVTTAHATQTAEGVLEKGAPYSALFGGHNGQVCESGKPIK